MPEIIVSVIIPAYNAAQYITETIISVQQQTFPAWEIIVVNDGSKDNTAAVVSEIITDNIVLINQPNAGVSAARNWGMAVSKGAYLIFLDADDLLTPDFLQERVKVMEDNPSFGFVGGWIETFPDKTFPRKAAAENPVKEILFFDAGFATVPSNYLFRKSVLLEHKIVFNPELSSTADRFFILQLARYSKGRVLVSDKGKLLYRISEQSMSHNISPGLIRDNEKFYYEIRKAGLLPASNTGNFKSTYFFSLALGFGKIKKWQLLLKYFFYAAWASPACFFKLLFNKLFKKS